MPINSGCLNLILQGVSCTIRLDLAVIDMKYWFSILSKYIIWSANLPRHKTLSNRIFSLLNAEVSSINRRALNLMLSVLMLFDTFVEGAVALVKLADSSTAPCCRVSTDKSSIFPGSCSPAIQAEGTTEAQAVILKSLQIIAGSYLLWQDTQVISLHQEGSWV